MKACNTCTQKDKKRECGKCGVSICHRSKQGGGDCYFSPHFVMKKSNRILCMSCDDKRL